jgi:PTS system N-acetylglucosamine-specific IIC component
VGAAYFALYYGLFRFAIQRFDLKTPGREPETAPAIQTAPSAGGRGEDFLIALGGAANLSVIDACTTRLRLIIVNHAAVDEARLKALGARGFAKPSEKALQVVLGPMADQVAGEIRDAAGGRLTAPSAASTVLAAKTSVATPADLTWATSLLDALGGAKNVSDVALCASRLRLEVADAAAVSEEALSAAGARGLARISPRCVHVVLGPDAERAGAAMSALLVA